MLIIIQKGSFTKLPFFIFFEIITVGSALSLIEIITSGGMYEKS